MFTQMGTSGNLPFYFFFSKKFFTLLLLLLLCYYLLYTSSLYYFFFPYFSLFFLLYFFLFTLSFFSYTFLFMFLSSFLPLFLSFIFFKKDEPGRGRTCNLQIRSLTRFHCATGPSLFYITSLFMPCFFLFLPYVLIFVFTIGRFISSRIHPFPSEHGSKDA